MGKKCIVIALLGAAGGLFSAVFYLGVYYMCIVLKESYWYDTMYGGSVIAYALDLWGIFIVAVVLLWGYGILAYPLVYFNRKGSLESGILFTAVAVLFLFAALYIVAPILLL
jgi:hypothetical protein